MDRKITINDFVRTGWDLFKANVWQFLAILFILWVLSAIPNGLNTLFQDNVPFNMFINLVFMVPQIIFSMGMIKYLT